MGIMHKGSNAVYFGDYPTLFTEVIAGTIILLGLFGWMDLLILAKWLTPLDIEDSSPSTSTLSQCQSKSAGLETNTPEEDLIAVSKGDCDNRTTPSVINIMIDTVFNFGSTKTPGYRTFLGDNIDSMLTIGFALLIIVIILIPIMLFVKPCCFRGDHGDDHGEENNQIEFANINNIDQNNN